MIPLIIGSCFIPIFGIIVGLIGLTKYETKYQGAFLFFLSIFELPFFLITGDIIPLFLLTGAILSTLAVAYYLYVTV